MKEDRCSGVACSCDVAVVIFGERTRNSVSELYDCFVGRGIDGAGWCILAWLLVTIYRTCIRRRLSRCVW